ncbi:MAG TPA: NirA family protein [Verrucomicrobiae bacterium]|nr:NirA family protein [Verrucomicrobiae bacterium]
MTFNVEQKEYLAGLFAGIAQRQLHPHPYPYVGLTPEDAAGSGGLFTADPAAGGVNLAAPGPETIHGTPLEECTKQERWKRELHGLDAWDRLLEHAEQNKFPDEADQFRFRFHGLFHVAPAQNSFMLRCRIPAGELSGAQLRGLADLSDSWGNGLAAITTRSNLQIREIQPKDLIQVLTKLASLGLTSRGAGVDNVRNITASPTAGLDPQELLDVRPFAHALHHYILNHRDLYDLPRKFNVAFEGGGTVDTVADTNDIGFMAVRIPGTETGSSAEIDGVSLRDGARVCVPAGVYLRIELCGITGHKQFARDAGLVMRPGESVAVAAAMLRVFSEHGDRTDRKKARLKYLVDRWGVSKFIEETQKKLAFPLLQVDRQLCGSRPPSVRHGHIGVYRQKQSGRNWIGVVIPVGILTTRQMRRLAELAQNYGSGRVRLTPWQNLLIPDVPDGFVETVKRQLVRMGLHHDASNIMGGLVACTGNKGCKWSSTDTKGQAVALGQHLNQRLQLDQPLNIHLTGCPNSCAQHYLGDIGLQGVTVNVAGASVEGYNIVFGGGYGHTQGVAKQVFTGIPFGEIPALLERVLRVYLGQRRSGESFADFTRRFEVRELQEIFSG